MPKPGALPITTGVRAAFLALVFAVAVPNVAAADAQAFTPIKTGISLSGQTFHIYVSTPIANGCGTGNSATGFVVDLSTDTLAVRTLVNTVTTAIVSGRRLWISYTPGTCDNGWVLGANWFVLMDS